MILRRRSAALARPGLLLAAAFTLAAVAGAAETGPKNDYRPLAVGDFWKHSVKAKRTFTIEMGEQESPAMKTEMEGTSKGSVTKTDSKIFKPDTVFVVESEVKGTRETTADSETKKEKLEYTGETYYQQAEDAVLIRGMKIEDADLEKCDPPEIQLPTPVKVGSKWETQDYSALGFLQVTVPVKAEVTGTETVKVQAGEFKDCLVVEIEPRKKEFTLKDGSKLVITDWENKEYFAKGVGKAKARFIYTAKMTPPKEENVPAMSMVIKGTESGELTDYEVK